MVLAEIVCGARFDVLFDDRIAWARHRRILASLRDAVIEVQTPREIEFMDLHRRDCRLAWTLGAFT
jgi:hypothetical protein